MTIGQQHAWRGDQEQAEPLCVGRRALRTALRSGAARACSPAPARGCRLRGGGHAGPPEGCDVGGQRCAVVEARAGRRVGRRAVTGRVTRPASRQISRRWPPPDGRLHVLQRLARRLVALDGGVGVVLDRLGHGRVERGDRAGHGVGDGGLQRRQVRELGLTSAGSVYRDPSTGARSPWSRRLLLAPRWLEELQEVERGGLVLGVRADGGVVATQAARRRVPSTPGSGATANLPFTFDAAVGRWPGCTRTASCAGTAACRTGTPGGPAPPCR